MNAATDWLVAPDAALDELAAAYTDGNATPAADRVAALAERYDVEFLMDWAPELGSRYGVSLIHQRGR
ncbi:MAG: hypothetical protein L0221_05535 [Chloroflexi bacterium]|nr:hypothetical protein [Chloroflexota bacterium]